MKSRMELQDEDYSPFSTPKKLELSSVTGDINKPWHIMGGNAKEKRNADKLNRNSSILELFIRESMQRARGGHSPIQKLNSLLSSPLFSVAAAITTITASNSNSNSSDYEANNNNNNIATTEAATTIDKEEEEVIPSKPTTGLDAREDDNDDTGNIDGGGLVDNGGDGNENKNKNESLREQAYQEQQQRKRQRRGRGRGLCEEKEEEEEEEGIVMNESSTKNDTRDDDDNEHDASSSNTTTNINSSINSNSNSNILEDATLYDATIHKVDKWTKHLTVLKKKLENARVRNAIVLNTLYQIGAIRDDSSSSSLGYRNEDGSENEHED
ncbi:hypothetical protein FRACYDRAFT_241137 [Fragilariopsis cylindrus CCMP1102]|uniref:Uncharacterized protein n=1 Tax=Fragilariopsis cylindrus CCMP1102 TaxID=635003 RepID=A0A1E7F8U0_9STRA|nr:hypothetical protein FRACYDRAFT_241137 [Fragilariopsis cylindrus CCMP1102]|eukprot:OEU14588.1 hypothetical protein FRACYDRAFT_241137 [Fragilariopsis cylindrus CCMP1102]